MKKKSHTPQPPPLPPSFSSSSEDDSTDDDTSSQQHSPNTIISKTLPSNAKAKSSLPPSESKSEETENESSENSSSEHIVAATPPPSKKRKSTSGKAKEPEPELKSELKPEPSSNIAGSRKMFQRLWTDEEELLLAKGLVKYHANHGKTPVSAGDFSVLADEMKGVLQKDFLISQYKTKTKALYKKLSNHLVKGFNSSKENDKKCMDILKKIWGDELKADLTSSKKQVKEIANGHVQDVTMLDPSSPQKKKVKTKAVDQAQVAENEEEETDADIDMLEEIFDKHYMEASFKRNLKKRLLCLDPKEKQHWIVMFKDSMKSRAKLEFDFMQSILNKDDKEIEKKKKR